MKNLLGALLALGMMCGSAEAATISPKGAGGFGTYEVQGELTNEPVRIYIGLSVLVEFERWELPANNLQSFTTNVAVVGGRILDDNGEELWTNGNFTNRTRLCGSAGNAFFKGLCSIPPGPYFVWVDDEHRTLDIAIFTIAFGFTTETYPRAVLDLELPQGLTLVQTPLPAALPLFATVLGVGAWFAHRRRRKVSRGSASQVPCSRTA